jgi:hypothetical protein
MKKSILFIFLFFLTICLLFCKVYLHESMYEGGSKIGLHGLCSEDSDCQSSNCVEGRCVKYHGCI